LNFHKIFDKYSNTGFHENPSNGRRAVPSRQTDKHDEANSRFLQLCVTCLKIDTGFSKNSPWTSCAWPWHHSSVRSECTQNPMTHVLWRKW